MKLLLSEVLEIVDQAKTREEKVSLLNQYQTPCLRGLMRINFDDTVSMNLPEGTPPYKKEDDKPIGHDHVLLEKEYRKFYIWLSPTQLTQTKKEMLFIQMLESLHPSEAEIMILVKDKKLQCRYTTITEDLIRETWEFLMPPSTKKQVSENFTQESENTSDSQPVKIPKKRGRKPKNRDENIVRE